jgi:Zn-finger nucleic acid-binding protein
MPESRGTPRPAAATSEGTRNRRSCPSCGRSGPIELQMSVKTGQELTMLSCPSCETRSWLADGEPVPRDEVLRLTSGDPDFVVKPPANGVRKPRKR